MAHAETGPGSPFWRFSLGFYRQPGVAQACIALQDGCGVDVNIVLFFLWLATGRRCVSPDVARAVCASVASWRDDVVAPLRAIRRRLKAGSALIERAAAEELRAKVKAVELESERLQQEALFGLAAGLATHYAATIDAAARANVAAYEHVLGRALTPAAIATLLAALAVPP
ncbi:MAG: TIGR02444 family protein [Bradyrhizobiaceae bacterium]|nr:TIGR02444 family protein [Bradyrhizobiaceae bacterium]